MEKKNKMTKTQLQRKIKQALIGNDIPPGTDPGEMIEVISYQLAEAIAEYVKDPE